MKRFVIAALPGPALLAVAMLFPVPRTLAQSGYMPLGSVTVTQTNQQCPTNRGFPSTTDCQLATVTCPNTDPLALWYRVASPTNSQNNGTIVLLSGFGGTDAIESPGQEDSYVAKYTGQGYYAVQMAWGDTGGIPWEQANYLPNSTRTWGQTERFRFSSPYGKPSPKNSTLLSPPAPHTSSSLLPFPSCLASLVSSWSTFRIILPSAAMPAKSFSPTTPTAPPISSYSSIIPNCIACPCSDTASCPITSTSSRFPIPPRLWPNL